MILSKKKIAIITIFLFLGLSFFPLVQGELSIKKDTKQLSGNIFLGHVEYIDASDPYDYGLKVGQMYRPLFRLLDVFTILSTENKINEKETENQLMILEQSYPIVHEEFQGLSDGLNIKIERLMNIANFASLIFNGECTATTCTGKATKNNETFLTFNIDTHVDSTTKIIFGYLFHRLITYKCWVARINTIRYQYAFWGIPVLYELTFLNEEGLGWGSPATSFAKNRSVDNGPGISTSMLERLTMMTCKNVSEAAELWKSTERANQKDEGGIHQYDGSSEVFCDKEGGILMIEQTHSYIITVFRNSTEITGAPEDMLWHANHHIWLNATQTGSTFPWENMNSYYRTTRARELLEENYGNITLEVCKEICRDHGGGTDENAKDSSDICRHPDKNNSSITAFSWIIQPKEMTVYWTHGSACKSRFVKLDFTKIFEK